MVTTESPRDGGFLPDVTAEELDRLLASGSKLLFVDFWSDGCGPCKAMRPMLSEVAHELRDRVQMVAVNLDEHPLAMGTFKLTTLPTMLIFRGSSEVARLLGAKSRDDVVRAIGEQVP